MKVNCLHHTTVTLEDLIFKNQVFFFASTLNFVIASREGFAIIQDKQVLTQMSEAACVSFEDIEKIVAQALAFRRGEKSTSF